MLIIILFMNKYQSVNRNEVNAVVNADGSITLNGRNTTGAVFVIYMNMQTGYAGTDISRIPVLPSAKYVLSWETEGENDARIVVFKNGRSANNILADRPKDHKLEFTTDNDTVFITLRFGIISRNKTMTFKDIMIREAEIKDYAYEPAGENNRPLSKNHCH